MGLSRAHNDGEWQKVYTHAWTALRFMLHFRHMPHARPSTLCLALCMEEVNARKPGSAAHLASLTAVSPPSTPVFMGSTLSYPNSFVMYSSYSPSTSVRRARGSGSIAWSNKHSGTA